MTKSGSLEEMSKLRADVRQRLIDGKPVDDSEIVACYPGYEGLGMASWLFADAFAAHHMKIEAPWLDGPTQALFRLYPKCPVVLYFRCEYLYKFGAEAGLKKAQLLLEAEDDLVAQHDFLTNLYAQVLWNRGTRDAAVRKPFQAYAKARLMTLFEQYDCCPTGGADAAIHPGSRSLAHVSGWDLQRELLTRYRRQVLALLGRR